MYTVAKLNIGTPRTFKSRDSLGRAIRRAGAEWIQFTSDAVIVRWPSEGAGLPPQVVYRIDEQGNVDQQLAWDMEP